MEVHDVEKLKRRSYTREYKLSVVKWYMLNNKNKAVTARKFKLDRKQVRQWVQNENLIKETKQFTRKNHSGCPTKYPIAEQKLHEEFTSLRSQGKSIKRYWFNKRMCQLVRDYYPHAADEFKNSDQGFQGFGRRFRVTLRRKTHTAQKSPEEVEVVLRKFHKYLLRERMTRKYELSDIANMDQTGCAFIIDDGKTYDTTGAKDVWCKTGQSGLDKRQCTVQLTVFADGVPRVKPLLIFRGKGLRIKSSEKQQWDKRVAVDFQPSAWCDEQVMLTWIRNSWGNYFQNPPTPGSDGKQLIADVHRAQQTPHK